MQLLTQSLYESFVNRLHFICISREDVVIMEWTPSNSHKNYILDMNIIQENEIENEYFFLNRGDRKIIHFRKGSFFYAIGTGMEVQNQLIEAFLDFIIEKFTEKYDLDMIFSFSGGSRYMFKSFIEMINTQLECLEELELVKNVRIPCTICKKTFDLLVKTSLIMNASSSPVPVVCIHEGHALLSYIDKEFRCRSTGKVNFAG